MSPEALSSSDFRSLFRTSYTSGESRKPWLFAAMNLTSPDEVVWLITASPIPDLFRGSCAA